MVPLRGLRDPSTQGIVVSRVKWLNGNCLREVGEMRKFCGCSSASLIGF